MLREILGCILDLIVCGRDEGSSSSVTSAGAMANDVAKGATYGQVGMRFNESTEGNASLLNLLSYICKTLGIDLEAVKIAAEGQGISGSPLGFDTEEELREPFGWPELQVGVVREAIAVAEALPGALHIFTPTLYLTSFFIPDYLSVAQFSLSSLKTLQDALAPGDQYHFYTTASRALQTAKRRGETRTVELWAANPLVSIIVTPYVICQLSHR